MRVLYNLFVFVINETASNFASTSLHLLILKSSLVVFYIFSSEHRQSIIRLGVGTSSKLKRTNVVRSFAASPRTDLAQIKPTIETAQRERCKRTRYRKKSTKRKNVLGSSWCYKTFFGGNLDFPKMYKLKKIVLKYLSTCTKMWKLYWKTVYWF